MDVTIGAVDLVGRAVGGVRADLGERFFGTSARERIAAALDGASGVLGEQVVVIRSLSCRAVVGLGQPFADDVLPQAIAGAVARVLRDHPFDDDVVVRFADTAAYLVAYLHDCRDGHGDRWYYAPLAPFLDADGTVDWPELIAAHRAEAWRILARMDGAGELESLLGALGADTMAGLAADAGAGAASLAATAIAMVRTAGVELRAGVRPAVPAVPDWRDPVNLGGVLGVMVRELIEGADAEAVVRVARGFDWFDQGAFEAAAGFTGRVPHPGDVPVVVPSGDEERARTAASGSSRGPATAAFPATPAAGPSEALTPGAAGPAGAEPEAGPVSRADAGSPADVVSPAALTPPVRLDSSAGSAAPADSLAPASDSAVDDPMASAGPASPAESVSLSPQAAVPSGASALPGAVPAVPSTPLIVERWGDAAASATVVVSPRTRRVLADLVAVIEGDGRLFLDAADPGGAANVIRLVAALIRYSPRWCDDEHARSVAAQVLRVWGGCSALPGPAGGAETGTGGPVGLASYKIGLRFGRSRSVRFAPSGTAAGLLLFRTLRDLGLGAGLLNPLPGATEPLLVALLRGWTGAGDEPDPLVDFVSSLPVDADDVDDVGQVARRMIGQRLVLPPLRIMELPDGGRVVVGAEGRIVPLPVPDGRAGDVERELGVDISGHATDDPDPAPVLAALASVDASRQPGRRDSRVALLAAACVQVWGRWLPGFGTASVGFLLDRLVRRPAEMTIDGAGIGVRMPARPHDVVLKLAGYLDPVEPPTILGGRGIRFD
ncbi:hypothetical protein AB0C07_37070 [Actinoplanes missouriensis]|uniref:hypothetical protein n=1 Tax=Actinoplanes missouriensis TaxID=1866 RepID=UPI0033C85C4E